jgi:5-methylthioadenosine/S-adenosylhomocysteine deaminase
VASNNRMDLLDEARVAHLMASAREHSWSSLRAESALTLITAGAANALGLWNGLGTLAVGAPADLCAFPLDGLSALPVYDVCDALVHGVAGAPTRLTVVAGQVVVSNGQLTGAAAETRSLVRLAAITDRLRHHRAAARSDRASSSPDF